MESSLFEDLLCFLQKEELVLKALRATNLKACLRTGTGTKGYEANAERAKYYRIYNKIEKSVTADQKATLMDWGMEKAEVSGTLCVATEPKLSAQNGSTSCTATVRGIAAEGSILV